MNIIGVDLAKEKFSFCVMNKTGRVLLRKDSRRNGLIEAVAKQGPGIVAMEACGGAHYWARCFKAQGYDVRIMAAQFVKPFVKSNKNDEIDAEAICEAASRPQMRFVSARSEEQQDLQNLHRVRERLIRHRNALSNEIRGLLLEYGIVIAKGISHVRNRLPGLIEEHGGKHSQVWRATFCELYEEFCYLEERIEHYDKRLVEISRMNEACQRLQEIPGVGVLISTAIVAAVGNPKDFKNGRQFAAWLGLVPRQNSTGGRTCLGSITKRGNKYIRKLLVQGACSCGIAAQRKYNHKDPLKRVVSPREDWLLRLAKRRSAKKAMVAMANKMARTIWVVLNGKDFMQTEFALAA